MNEDNSNPTEGQATDRPDQDLEPATSSSKETETPEAPVPAGYRERLKRAQENVQGDHNNLVPPRKSERERIQRGTWERLENLLTALARELRKTLKEVDGRIIVLARKLRKYLISVL